MSFTKKQTYQAVLKQQLIVDLRFDLVYDNNKAMHLINNKWMEKSYYGYYERSR